MNYIYDEIKAERKRQDEKWGVQDLPMVDKSFNYQDTMEMLDHVREINGISFAYGNGSWYYILKEEIYEAFVESDPERQREEMIQVAAVAVAIIECLDRKKEKKETE